MKSAPKQQAEDEAAVAPPERHDVVTGLEAVAEAREGDVTFFGNAKYLPALKKCRASAALVPSDFSETISAIQIKVANPSLAFAKLVEKFAPAPPTYEPGVHSTAVIGKN